MLKVWGVLGEIFDFEKSTIIEKRWRRADKWNITSSNQPPSNKKTIFHNLGIYVWIYISEYSQSERCDFDFMIVLFSENCIF